ncbi:MAG: 6-carboxytetrahydropterin synthase [Cyanobacteria bacterium P01_H01_bin.74]
MTVTAPDKFSPPYTEWVTLVRKVSFSAAHFLWLNHLTEAENQQRFGLSSNPLGHGHNYEIDVAVSGQINPETGMVINLKQLKKILSEEVLSDLDFKNLNRQVPYFKNKLTTLENLAFFIWDKLTDRFEPMHLCLNWLKVLENDDLYVNYSGGKDNLMAVVTQMPAAQKNEIYTVVKQNWVYLTRTYNFPASHRLFNPEWTDEENEAIFQKCNNINGHGHNYGLEVTVKGDILPELGMVIDIYELDSLVNQHLLDWVDHKNLNLDVPFLAGIIPTTENLARAFWKQLSDHIPAPAQLARIRLIETPNNFADYFGPSLAYNQSPD